MSENHKDATKRMHELVHNYWDSLKHDRPFPKESEIEPELITDAWDNCFLVDMRRGSVENGFRYDFMGNNLIDAYGMNMTSIVTCDPSTQPHVASMLQHFNDVVSNREASVDESEFKNIHNQLIKYRCCLLPLGQQGDKVDYILGCMNWRAF